MHMEFKFNYSANNLGKVLFNHAEYEIKKNLITRLW